MHMKRIYILVVFTVLCICSCGQDLKHFKSQYPLAQWYCDTLGTYKGKNISMYYDEALGSATGIFWGDELLAEGSKLWARKGYEEPGVIYVTDGITSARLQMSNPDVLQNIRAFNKACGSNEVRLLRQYEKPIGPKFHDSKVQYSIVFDYPSGKRQGDIDVLRWLVTRVDKDFRINPGLAFGPQIEHLAEKSAWGFIDRQINNLENEFDDWEDFSLQIRFSIDLEKEDEAPGYVTYCEQTYYYGGGAHGMPGEEFVSFSKMDKKEISFHDCFGEDAISLLKQLLYKSFLEESERTEQDCPFGEFDRMLSDIGYTDSLPSPGIKRGKFIFSFQPYELGCFAEGIYHLMVDIESVKPYIKATARRALSL